MKVQNDTLSENQLNFSGASEALSRSRGHWRWLVCCAQLDEQDTGLGEGRDGSDGKRYCQ
jgi:hypothetical protein